MEIIIYGQYLYNDDYIYFFMAHKLYSITNLIEYIMESLCII